VTRSAETRSVLAFAKKPVGAVMMRPILERLREDPNVQVFGAARLFGRRDGGSVFPAAGLRDLPRQPLWWSRLRSFDVYISADFGVLARRARLKVHVFHGVSFRNHAVHNNALRYDLCLLAGPYMRRRFEEAGIITGENEHRFPVIGMPKLDDLALGRYDREQILTELGLDPSKPTVLYAPTWSRKMSSLERFGEDVLRALRDLPTNVIVKLHDNSFDLRKASSDWRAKVRAHTRDGFVLDEGVDVAPRMAVADVLISDASSVANEFTLVDRPILFLDVADLASKVKAKADLQTWGRQAGVVVKDPSSLAAAVDHALADPGALSDVRRALASDLFLDPGTATDRAVSAIRERMGRR